MVEAWRWKIDNVVKDFFILEAQCQQTFQIKCWSIELVCVEFVERLEDRGSRFDMQRRVIVIQSLFDIASNSCRQ